MEQWKQIPNSKHYAVSSEGRVKRLEHGKWNKVNNSFSHFKEKLLKPSDRNTKGYMRIRIYYSDDSSKMESVHRLVALCFIDNPFGKPQVNHKDGDKANNAVENLEWVDQKENMEHRRKVLNISQGVKGERCNFSRLTEDQVKDIPNLLNRMNKRDIARLYNVSPSTITEITSGRSWKHLNLFTS